MKGFRWYGLKKVFTGFSPVELVVGENLDMNVLQTQIISLKRDLEMMLRLVQENFNELDGKID